MKFSRSFYTGGKILAFLAESENTLSTVL